MTDGPRAQPTLTTEVPADVETEHAWLWRFWLLVVAFVALTVWRGHDIGIPLRDPHGRILGGRIALSAALFVVFALLDATLRTPRGSRGRTAVGAVLRRRWPRRRLLTAATGLLGYHLVYFSYHNLKSWDVFNRLQEDLLERMDRWLFLGHTPASLLHGLLGEHYATYVLVVVYGAFSYIVSASFVAAVVFLDRLRDGYVFLTALVWAWIIGVGSYYLIPSLGPFHSSPEDFAGLPDTQTRSTQARFLVERAHLLAHPEAPDAYAQVSAFASLHVAVTFVIVLMLRYYGFRRPFRVMAVYLACTIVATIFLGWHYAVDDIAGLLIGAVAVLLGRLVIYPRGKDRHPAVPTGP